jgi:hypothetical protein
MPFRQVCKSPCGRVSRAAADREERR